MNTVASQIRAVLEQHLRNGGLVLGDSVRSGGLGGSTASLQSDDLINTPIGDRSALGLGLGLALAGRAVVVELASATSLVSSILADAVRATGFRPTLVIRVAYGGTGALDALALPQGVQVWSSSGANAAAVLSGCLEGGVHVILEARTGYFRRCAPAEPVAVLRQGKHATIATWGEGVPAALSAADELQSAGIDAGVFELVQLSPVPTALIEAVVSTGRLVVAHPGAPCLAGSIKAAVLDGAFLYLESPLSDCNIQSHAVVAAVRDSVHY